MSGTEGKALGAEFTGTALLLATVVGSGIMADRLSGGSVALALIGNTFPTGAILVVLIGIFGPISGAHFNPAVTMVAWLRREIAASRALLFLLAQIAGGIAGVLAAHLMFEESLFQVSVRTRTGPAQWFAEFVATGGLVLVILGTLRFRRDMVAASVGLYITAAYWFTASTSFANPAVTVARSLTASFSGIRPADVPAFVLAQLAGALAAWAYCRWQFANGPAAAGESRT